MMKERKKYSQIKSLYIKNYGNYHPGKLFASPFILNIDHLLFKRLHIYIHIKIHVRKISSKYIYADKTNYHHPRINFFFFYKIILLWFYL